ncbi:unnamed protein product (macronuclear) [Paramecium tetraurelia]|uniref:Uncharacterized protein n=1 Tax=Paramecium tetraurelia TaxID=5888 RepID=A0EAH0_PARTE|nr:uncharacterized protein GSPATT00025019001 [Paramecium tetraurelia]CAK92287.1 unnamed protein product [Paramecium tetraurelia]|eukprot:XP_001459684.1 hypothetical protein (macronuclear) [Paramecium tetraurelia strain d4-2]
MEGRIQLQNNMFKQIHNQNKKVLQSQHQNFTGQSKFCFKYYCQTSELVIIKGETLETKSNRIRLQGKFNIRKLNYYTIKIKYQLQLICKEVNAEQFCIYLELNDEILSPFTNVIMPQFYFGYIKDNNVIQ